MSSLVSITATSPTREPIASHVIHDLPVIVLSPHNRCNCRCMMCDIWRIREARSITPAELDKQLPAFRDFGVRWVVFSGGEPQLNDDWFVLARMLRSEGIRVTILTAGLLLESQAELVASSIDDLIVSLDGPATVHNQIRRVPGAFQQLAAGVRAVRQLRPELGVRARCTVQKANYRSLIETLRSAKEIGLNSISFLAADATSEAFNRQDGWPEERQERIMLDTGETDALEREIEQLIAENVEDLKSGFVTENESKLRRIVRHFRAHLGQSGYQAPRCNAPWVSAVIDASGEVRPCFFHAPIGNIHTQSLREVLNGPQALRFRSELDVATNSLCQKCVCSLYLQQENNPVAATA